MADKTLTIKGASDKDLDDLITRLSKECRAVDLVAQLKRSSSSDPYNYGPQQVSTEEPVESLYHYGKLGMRWGHRKVGVGITPKRQDARDKAALDRLNNGGHVSGGITKKRQEAFDKRDKAALEKRISDRQARAQKKVAKAEARAAQKREKQLRSPTKLYRNRDKFNQEEIDQAMKRMKWERELRSLSRDEITTGSQYANAILGYGTVAVAAYGVYKSPLGQALKKAALKQ